ncbi:MAG: hypothetical protein HUU47_04260 [Bacteroidetes bacterium]|nr:hypothetical protein [Bacteroidota bacterium]
MKRKIKIYTSAIIIAFAFTMASCGSSSAKEEIYQCPMKCEGEKTYNKPGTCPVCEMDLEVVENSQHDSTHKK